MSEFNQAFIGIGSNLQQPVNQVRWAIDTLTKDAAIDRVECSGLYQSAPVGIAGQPDFINAVCMVRTGLSAPQLLELLQSTEQATGRKRNGERWGPRTLDLDLLLYNQVEMETEKLVLPHPRMHERAFVLYPLLEIAPALEIPGHGPVRELAKNCSAQRCTRIEPETGSGRSK